MRGSAVIVLLFGEKQVHGTVDQLTAYFIVERQLAQRGTCTLTVPVFDGSALYNLDSLTLSEKCCPLTGIRPLPVRHKSVRSCAKIWW